MLEIVQKHLVPALLGLLGALVLVLRDIGARLRTYAYVPDSLFAVWGRTVGGMMAGVLGGAFPSSDSVAKSTPRW